MTTNLNERVFLTRGQIKRLAKGKLVHFIRGGKRFTLGIKPINSKENRLRLQIRKLKVQLDAIKSKKRGK